jgi:hypothetical protein
MAGYVSRALVNPLSRQLRPFALIFVVYVLATWFTDAFFMGDTWIYVSDLLKAESLGASFRDFGHALWLPFGWLVSRALSSVMRLGVGDDARANVTLALLGINWVAGLVGTLLVHSLARRFSSREWPALLVAMTFLFSNAILNYSQTAQPYVPGLALLLAGLHLLLQADRQGRLPFWRALLAGAALAGGVCLWVALVLAIPALLMSPLFLLGFDRPRVRLVTGTTLVFALLVALVYVSMIVNLGIHDLAGLRAWIASSTHGVSPDVPLKAIQRMVFGFARNFVNMGDDGRLFKRYLVHDPFNPVSFFQLFRLSLWKLALFYVLWLSVVINLLRSRLGRRMLALLVLNGLPVVVFALFLFESGSIDRYLPLFPLLFLALSVALSGDRPAPGTRGLALTFVVVVISSNLSAMSATTLNRAQAQAATRIQDLEPLLTGKSRVVTVNQQDEVYAFNQNFPFHPINRSGRLDADILVDPNSTLVQRWRRIFATKTLAMWDNGGDVWITTRVLHRRPLAAWNWVEGDDRRLRWEDIYVFFSRLETGRLIAGADGFVLLSPSPRNKQTLREVVSSEP